MAPLLNILVVKNSKTLLNWFIVGGVPPHMTLTELRDALASPPSQSTSLMLGDPQEIFDCMSKHMTEKASFAVGRDKISQDVIFPSAKLEDVVEFGQYIKITLNEDIREKSSETTPSRRNAFQILMDNHLETPTKLTTPANRKTDLHNAVIDWLSENKLGWHKSAVSVVGERFVKVLINALWYIGPHVKKLSDRSCQIPSAFQQFVYNYNKPASHKHKIPQIESSELLQVQHSLEQLLEEIWFQGHTWLVIKNSVAELSATLHRYHRFLLQSKERTQAAACLAVEKDGATDETDVFSVYPRNVIVKPTFAARYKRLNTAMNLVGEFEPHQIDEYGPNDRIDRRYFLDNVKKGVTYKCVHYKVTLGCRNTSTMNFLWKVPQCLSEEEILRKNATVIDTIKKQLPKYFNRKLRREFIKKMGLVSSIKPYELRLIYRQLTGDSSLPTSPQEAEIDQRLETAFLLGDPDIIIDLREHNKKETKYEVFFEKTQEYLNNVVETAVDERRHDPILHVALALSLSDFHRKIKETCPEGTPIPSKQWLYLQFAPKHASSHASLQHTGKLDVKYLVQSRQYRAKHPDLHYASALFSYEKHMAVKLREFSTFFAMDDKHHIKVGEPGNPVAAVDRGKQVLCAGNLRVLVSDHDFTKFGIIPSVSFQIDIPEDVTESFYRGTVHVGVKDIVLEPSSPLRHATELSSILGENTKPILFLYTDGGPDHRLTYLSVQLTLLCLFLKHDLDMLVAVRTPPMASWKNPAERIMSLINLALQGVGMMRSEQDSDSERKLRRCNGIHALRNAAAADKDLELAMKDSVECVKVLLGDLFKRLSLKGKPFEVFPSASTEMAELWKELDKFGTHPMPLKMKQADLKKELKARPLLWDLLTHCTTARQYSFVVKKCGSDDCKLCGKVRVPPEVFEDIHTLPDPVPGDEGHYKPFEEVCGTKTTGDHCPSLNKATKKRHEMPFQPSAQTAGNVKRTVTCTECEKDRVIYAAKKLSGTEVSLLDKILDLYMYTCGSSLQELMLEGNRSPHLTAVLSKVFVKANLECSSEIEVPYFSSGLFQPICIYCASVDILVGQEAKKECQPMCGDCSKKRGGILKRKASMAKKESLKKAKRYDI